MFPKLEYPATFEHGLIGVRCTEDIEFREAYLFVPYKMLMSVKNAQMHDVIGPVILDHPECFEADEHEDWEQLTLVLYVYHEMTLGRDSYWYPYLRCMPDVQFACSWEEHELDMLQDPSLDELITYKTEVDATCD